MKRSKKTALLIAITFLMMAMLAAPASAQLASFVTEDASNIFYEYNYSALSASYSSYQVNQSAPAANLYKDFAANASRIRAILNSKGEYVSYAKVQADYSAAQTAGQQFNASTYVETAPLYTSMPSSVTVVTLDSSSNVVKNVVSLVPAPTASAFSIGGTGVTTVNGALSGNAITFTVDPSATYTTASVNVSADVYVTVTKYGATTPSRTDVNVEKGTLTADAGMLSAFTVTKTSATGQELLSQTASGPITVLLKSQADQTKTTTYTVNFVAAQ